jgi:hypothetical protein
VHLNAVSAARVLRLDGLLSPGWIVVAAAAAVLGGFALIWIAASGNSDRRARVREVVASLVQHVLLFGFAGVAAAISAHGLIGFARANMGLRGPWPALLWGALDGAAGLCAVLLMRRAARGESALAPRLAVWGLVAASSVFNWTHAPDHPGARVAFAMMPLIAATLFEFSLRETRHTAEPAGRRLASSRWLHPAERIKVWAELAADETLTSQAATTRVRIESAAQRLHELRRLLESQARSRSAGFLIIGRLRRAERRAQAGLARARFTEPGLAAGVLRQAQILTLTSFLATLDYSTAQPAQVAIASLIPPPGSESRFPAACNAIVRPPAFLGQLTPSGPGLHGLEPLRWPNGSLTPNGHGGAGLALLTDLEMSAPPGSDPLLAAAQEVVRKARSQGHSPQPDRAGPAVASTRLHDRQRTAPVARLGQRPGPGRRAGVMAIPQTGQDWGAMLSAFAHFLKGPGSPPAPPAGSVPWVGLWDALTWLARREGFTVSRSDCDGATSRTRWTARHITVSADLGTPAAELALAHEVSHVLMHRAPWLPGDVTTAGCRGTRQLEADSVAFVVASWLGLSPAGFSWPCPSTWAGTDSRAQPEATIRASADRILQTAAAITGHLSVTLYSTTLEEELMAGLDLPLNLQGNSRHSFHPVLTRVWKECADNARALPVLANPGTGGR